MRLIICSTFFLLGVAGQAAEPRQGEFANETIKVGKDTREYRLVVPKSVDLEKPAPLVFAFHGFLIDSKDAMPVYSKLNDAAAKHRFILVYPNALDKAWGILPEKVTKDLEFFDALLKKLKMEYQIDENRIYLTGMSNGGYWAHLVGKERSKVVAAVASHSGPLGLQTILGINAERKFPVMIIHGDKDNIFKIDIARENRDKYKKEGHDVLYKEIAGQRHWWAADKGINDEIWKFFAANPLDKKK
ncbi:MAG: PHB depolymerase family esterase [Gemmataceae bacterium]